jgi:hypothetical protein
MESLRSTKKVDVFIAGSQKTGSTWLYACFKEHPEIHVPKKDAIHYFTINHDLGHDWYHQWYENGEDHQIWCDATPSYIRDPEAAKRIFDYNPKAKLIFVLRNPIDRAFSHYWHMKRKGFISYSFEDMISYNGVGNIDLFQMWYYSSRYSYLLKPYLELFPREQIHFSLFDHLKEDPKANLQSIFRFCGVDNNFEPSILFKNKNSGSRGYIVKKTRNPIKWLNYKWRRIIKVDEYKQGIKEEIRNRLRNKFNNEIEELSKLTGFDLEHWK